MELPWLLFRVIAMILPKNNWGSIFNMKLSNKISSQNFAIRNRYHNFTKGKLFFSYTGHNMVHFMTLKESKTWWQCKRRTLLINGTFMNLITSTCLCRTVYGRHALMQHHKWQRMSFKSMAGTLDRPCIKPLRYILEGFVVVLSLSNKGALTALLDGQRLL